MTFTGVFIPPSAKHYRGQVSSQTLPSPRN